MLDLKIPFLVDEINLVYRNKRRYVHAVPLYGINQVVLRCTTPDKYVCIHHLTFRQDRPDFIDIEVESTDRMKAYPPCEDFFIVISGFGTLIRIPAS